MHISRILCPHTPQTHTNFNFIDIRTDGDTRLFTDPLRIAYLAQLRGAASVIKSMNESLEDFYRELHHAYFTDDTERIYHLLNHAHEINATRLGYSSTSRGKGSSREGLVATLQPFQEFVQMGIPFENISDMAVVIDNFDADRLSDMTTNIIFSHLAEFTVSVCDKYGYPVQDISRRGYRYWCSKSNDWQSYEGQCLVIDGKVILLTPKEIVVKGLAYNTESYFSRVIVTSYQERQTTRGKDGKVSKPNRKYIRKKLLQEKSTHDWAVDTVVEKPDSIIRGRREAMARIDFDGLSDVLLDKIAYD